MRKKWHVWWKISPKIRLHSGSTIISCVLWTQLQKTKKQNKKKTTGRYAEKSSVMISQQRRPRSQGEETCPWCTLGKKTKKRKSSPREPFYLQRGFLLPTTLCTLPRRHIGQFDSFTSHPLTFIHSHSVWVLPLKSFVSLQLLKNMSNPSGHRTDLLAALNCEVCCY